MKKAIKKTCVVLLLFALLASQVAASYSETGTLNEGTSAISAAERYLSNWAYNSYMYADKNLTLFLNFRVTEADDILPAAAGKKTYCMMETIMLVRLFNINLYTPAIKQMRIYDLGMVVHGEKWIHHKLHDLLFSG